MVNPKKGASGIGTIYGTSRDAPFDRWFRYPAGFNQQVAEGILERLDVCEGALVVDPFAGSGVAGTTARGRGLKFFGVEAHPAVAELAQAKLAWPRRPRSDLGTAAKAAIGVARACEGLSLEGEAELVRRCFSDDVLLRLVALREAIRTSGSAWETHLRWALLATLRDVASVKVGWPYQLPGKQRQAPHKDVFDRFEARTAAMSEDMEALGATRGHRVKHGDSRTVAAWRSVPTDGASGCITSPPYLNNFDYADATRLELYFLGEVRTWAEMCQEVRIDMVIATTQQTRRDIDAAAQLKLAKLAPSISAHIEPLRMLLEGQRTERGRGKEYDRVISRYFLDMYLIFKRLRRVLKPGATAGWLVGDSAPYGVFIDTPALLGECAKAAGFSVVGDELVRHRGQRWASNAKRHQVPLSERLLLVR